MYPMTMNSQPAWAPGPQDQAAQAHHLWKQRDYQWDAFTLQAAPAAPAKSGESRGAPSRAWDQGPVARPLVLDGLYGCSACNLTAASAACCSGHRSTSIHVKEHAFCQVGCRATSPVGCRGTRPASFVGLWGELPFL